MKTFQRNHFLNHFLIGIAIMLSTPGMYATTYYVKLTATGSNNGSSWANSFTALQNAIDLAIVGDEIWVASATYTPTVVFNGTSVRNRTFYINKEISIFGGFAGTTGTEGDFSSRDVLNNPTILSGNIGVSGVNTDNVFHVVYLDHVGTNMHLDGFEINDGYAKDGDGLENTGAGIYNDGQNGVSSPSISNCHFDNNQAFESGGAFVNLASDGEGNAVFLNCSFTRNSGSGGGAIANVANPNGDASPSFVNCSFKGNSGLTAGGGAITNIAVSGGECSPQFINCLFSGNLSSSSGAIHTFANGDGIVDIHIINCTFAGNQSTAVSSSAIGGSECNVSIENSILWNNGNGTGISDNGSTTTATFSIVPFGFAGTGNFSDDPLLVSVPDFNITPTIEGDLHLQPGSPATDAGNNDLLPNNITTDIDGSPRYINPNTGTAGNIDMGAFEFQGFTAVTGPVVEKDWQIYPNPASDEVVLAFDPSVEPECISIYDLQGRLLLQEYPQKHAAIHVMQIGHLLPGIYMVYIQSKNGISAKSLRV